MAPLACRSASAFCRSDKGSGVATPICARAALWRKTKKSGAHEQKSTRLSSDIMATSIMATGREKQLLFIGLISANLVRLNQQFFIGCAKLFFQIFVLLI